MKQPNVQEKIVSNVWFHTMMFEKAGDFKNGHKHNFDHAHLVCQGSIEVYVMDYCDGSIGADRKLLGTFKQGDIFLVPKNQSHTVIALEDNTFGACIQGVKDGEEEEMQSCFCDGSEWKKPDTVKL